MENVCLMYHDVVNEQFPTSGFQKVGARQYTIDSSEFDKHLKIAGKAGNVFFSFDDGGDSFYNVILESLSHYDKKGIFFIATSYIGTPHFLTEEQIGKIDKAGHVIASHSHTHPAKISALSKEDCLKEWLTSKEILENIVGHEVTCASVPGGAVSEMVIDCMIEAGFKEIYTSSPTTEVIEKNGVRIYGRYGVKNTTTEQVLKKILNSPAYRKRLLMNHQLLGIAKRLLGSQYNNVKQFILKLKRG